LNREGAKDSSTICRSYGAGARLLPPWAGRLIESPLSRRKRKRQSAFGGGTTCLLWVANKGIFAAAKDGAVACPGIFIHLFEVVHQACS